MKIPTTREDFIEIGKRYDSVEIIAEIDRLSPVAQGDIGVLRMRGFPQSHLDELRGYRGTLGSETADRTRNRGSKKAARMTEQEARGKGVRLLRSGVALATSAVSARPAPEGEAPETTQEIVQRFSQQIRSLSGILAGDTASVRTRLEALRGILRDPELRPAEDLAEGITELVALVDEVLASLPTKTEQKEAAKQAAIVDTADLDELDGRAYWSLRRLTMAGAAAFRERGELERAKPYHLRALNDDSTKKDPTTK